jgi:hypothetical protein
MEQPILGDIIEMVMEGKIDIPQLFGGIPKKIVTGDIGGAIKDIKNVSLEQALEEGESAIEMIKQVDPRELWKKVEEKVFDAIMTMFRENAFHSGGLVPSFAYGGEVPAMLQPGEFVINRQATRNNFGTIESLNRNLPAAQAGDTNITVTINAKTNLTADQIRREVVPELERTLKRKSQEGAFILASSGVRS